jgi:prepilin peptidase dependent protein B
MLRQVQRGVSLIELLIGIMIGAFLITGVAIFYSNNSQINNQLISTVRLEYEMQTAMKLMKDDIRRAGFNSAAAAFVATSTVNPFMVTGTTDIRAPNANCILFSYDLNLDGTVPALNTATSDDRFGYRLDNQVIQVRPTTDAEFSCTAANWEELTNPDILQITDLTFVLAEDVEPLEPSNPGGESITVRNVTINMTGQLTHYNTVQRTISSTVRVRNDKYQP